MSLVAEPTTTDEELVKKFLGGDQHAFTELVRRHKAWVITKAAHYSQNSQETDDLAQTIFIKAFRNLHSFGFRCPFRHWLARIATNACHDHLRKRRSHSWLFFLPQHSDNHDVPALPDIPDTSLDCSGTDAETSMHILLPLLAPAIRRLAPADQLLITLKEIEQKSLEEISSLTGWSIANVKVRAHRARHRLKTILEKMTRQREGESKT
jgi:RNA polymerase sigma-70 factor (ECF subfamily)